MDGKKEDATRYDAKVQAIRQSTTGTVSEEEIREQKTKIEFWVEGHDFEYKEGEKRPTREEIFKEYETTPVPIATLPSGYLKEFTGSTNDPRVYCSEAYFMDHAINHHPELDPLEYKKIKDIISHPDAVKKDTRKDRNSQKERDSLLFIKKYKSNTVVVVSLDKNPATGENIVFHKSNFRV